MSNIEERVVGMKFDNAQFEKGVKTTLASLEALNKGLKLDGATKGLGELHAAGNRVSLDHIGHSVDAIANRFKAMSIIAITALSNIANKAFDAGANIVKSLTIAPISAGLREYETNLNSIQTILANTAWQNTGLNDVNKALQILNDYSDQTIYNFSEMARNIGTFTAAGVKLDVATAAIKGIANLAAISGSNAEQASAAMYQLSQALAAGRLTLMDWNSVVNAGMGGKVFQDALMETARIHGVAIDQMVKDSGSFRNTLEKGWLTGEILTETLSKFTGDLTAAQLKTMGYNDQQIEGILKMGRTAQDAATKVKTFTQLLGTLQEAAGSGWAKTWQAIFGDFEEAKALFTNVNNVLGGFISASSDARNKVIADWKELGGRTAIINAIGNAFNALIAILRPIGKAFRDVFPATTGAQLAQLSKNIEDFTKKLTVSGSTADKIRRVFAGFFSIFGLALDVIKPAVKVLFELFGVAVGGSGSFLDIAASIGDFLVALRKAINEGDGLIKFFQIIGTVLGVPIKLLNILAKAVASLFEDFDADRAAKGVSSFVKSLGPFGFLIDFISFAWGKLVGIFQNAVTIFGPISAKFAQYFSNISDAVGGIDFGDITKAISTGALVALVFAIKNALGGGGIGGAIEQLTGTLKGMQNALNAATLLQIAIAIGIIALSASELAKIDAGKLASALAGLTIMFGQLIGAMAVMSTLPGGNIIKLYGTAAAMTVLAIAIRILASSVKALSDLSWQELVKGLVGVGVLLAAITAAANFLPSGVRLIGTAAGLIVLAVAIKILASAVTDLSDLSWEEMAKGLVGVGTLLGALMLFVQFAKLNAGGLITGAGIILLAVGIRILAEAVGVMGEMSWGEIARGITTLAGAMVIIGTALALIPPTSALSAAGVFIVAASLGMIGDALIKMGDMSWAEIGRGLTVLAGALTAIGLAISLIPPTAVFSAAGILIVAVAIGLLAKSLKEMGGMSWDEIAHGLTALGGALGIITAALLLLPAALPGAFALLVVSGALLVLSGVLLTLGNMSWGEIVKGLTTLALVFVVLGVSALLIAPVVPILLALGAAILLLGAGIALAGLGLLLFATGLTALSVSGVAGAAAIVAIIAAVVGTVPMIAKAFGIALLIVIDTLIVAIPKITELMIGLILGLLDGLDKVLPKLAVLIIKLIGLILTHLEEAAPKFYRSGLAILIGILEAIRDNIGQVVTTAVSVIVNFINGIANNLHRIIQAGVNLIISFIEGLTRAINNNSERMGRAGADLATAIVNGMISGLRAAAGRLGDMAANIAKGALDRAKRELGIDSPSKEFMKLGEFSGEGMVIGLHSYKDAVAQAGEDVGTGAIDALRDTLSDLPDILDANMDVSPRITPVLDLTNVKKNSAQLDAMLAKRSISTNSTFQSAKNAAVGVETNQEAARASDDGSKGDTYNYTQNNTSPKALSDAEIYRQTKNQLSIAAKKGT